MKRWNGLLTILLLPGLSFSACAGPAAHGLSRPALVRALERSSVVSPDRFLTHFSHTCDLELEGHVFHVLDVREIVPNMPAPRGINRIVVLDEKLELVQDIRYFQERPLRCDGNRLLVFGNLALRGEEPAGNVLVFRNGAGEVSTEQVEWSALSPEDFSRYPR